MHSNVPVNMSSSSPVTVKHQTARDNLCPWVSFRRFLYHLYMYFSEEDSWPVISSENRNRHEILFYSQGPVDGYLIGKLLVYTWRHASQYIKKRYLVLMIFLHLRTTIFYDGRLIFVPELVNQSWLNLFFFWYMHIV